MFISHFKSLSGKARHQGLLTHDQEGIFTTEIGKRLPQRSPSPLAMPLASVLVTICLLLWIVQNAITTHKSDSLVGGNSKRMTLTPLSSSCVGSDSRRVISHSLTTPNFSVRRRMMPSPPSKAAFPWHSQRHSLRHTGTLIVLPMRKHEKSGKILEAASLLPEMLPGFVLVIAVMLFGSDIYSLFPTVQHHGDPRHHLRHPLPSLHRRVPHLRLIPDCPSPITTFKHAKKLPLTGEFFHSADAEIILRS